MLDYINIYFSCLWAGITFTTTTTTVYTSQTDETLLYNLARYKQIGEDVLKLTSYTPTSKAMLPKQS